MRPEETALLHGAGRLRCLGGQQHLKSKYGGGYTLELRVVEHGFVSSLVEGEAVLAASPPL